MVTPLLLAAYPPLTAFLLYRSSRLLAATSAISLLSAPLNLPGLTTLVVSINPNRRRGACNTTWNSSDPYHSPSLIGAVSTGSSR